MKIVQDQTGEIIKVSDSPNGIISLVPSLTELLIDLGLNVIGRTKFCIHPSEMIKTIPIIGGTKNFKMDTIHQLNPDLIIGNKEENYESGIIELREKYPVFLTDINSLEDSLDMMNRIGQLTNHEKDIRNLKNQIQEKHQKIAQTRTGSVLYLIWKKPWMVAGKNTYIDAMLSHLGYRNIINTARYPALSDSQLAELNPDHVLLSSEPYPFKEKDLIELNSMFPNSQVKRVNGEPYSWYGTRLLKCDF